MAEAGFAVVAIDHCITKPAFPITTLDLCSTTGQKIFWDLLQSPDLMGVHFGLPCGTASRARERKIPEHLRQLGVPEPPPLRSAMQPLGVDGLSGLNALKLQSANELYRLCARAVVHCIAHNIVVSIENPRNSHVWSALVAILRTEMSNDDCILYNQLSMVTFHSCCHGSSRQKLTGWLSTPEVYATLEARCANDHEHLPFGVALVQGRWHFDTSLEAAYPRLLAQRVAACLKAFLLKQGVQLTPQPKLHDLSTAAEGLQSKRHAALIPEYHHFCTLLESDKPPPNSKLTAPHQGGVSEEPKKGHVKYGIFHSPEQFLEKAMKLGHPMDTTKHLEDVTSAAVNHVLNTDPKLLKVQRKTALLKAKILAKKLEGDETKIHAGLSTSLQCVLADKKLLLWKELLEAHGYDDLGVLQFMFEGVELVGMPDAPACYPPKIVPASLTETDLRNTAIWRRKAMIGKRVTSGEDDHRAHLEETAAEEVAAKFLEGPFYSEDEVSARLGHNRWSIIRRFVLVQGAELKLRPIDDALEGQLNMGYTAVSYLKLQDIDYVVGMAMHLAEAITAGLQKFGSGRWQGKCLDLSKAYKQLAVKPEHRDLAVVFFRDTSDRTVFYIPNSLMFGSTAAVYAFNRVSRSLWFLLNKVLYIPCCVFYDDYTLFSPSESSEDADGVASDFLDLLGWRHARTGPKGLPFQEKFTVLGTEIDLGRISTGTVTLANKPGRVERIIKLLEHHMEKGSVTLHEAQVAHGLFRHACGFFAGRSFVQLCNELLSLGNPVVRSTTSQVKSVCSYAVEVLKCSAPRVVKCGLEKSPILVFTDGSWEKGEAGIGAVVLDQYTETRRVFAGVVEEPLIELWTKQTKHIICQIELYTMVLIRWLLKDFMRDRRCIFFVDNEAARFAAIKGSSDSATMKSLVRAFLAYDLTHPVFAWIERVASASNPADPPSRGKPLEACRMLGVDSWEPLSAPPELIKYLFDSLVCSRGKA